MINTNFKHQLQSILNTLKTGDTNIIGVEYGYKEIDNKLTNQLCYIVRVKKKLTNWEILWNKNTKKVPPKIGNTITDVQEGEFASTSVSALQHISRVKTPFVKNVNKNWYGSVGAFVTHKTYGRLYAVINRHVAGNVDDFFTYNDQQYGKVVYVAPDDAQLDCGVIELEDLSQHPLTVRWGITPKQPIIGDVVWINKGKNQPTHDKGVVIAYGLAQVRDSVLGYFNTRYFRVRPINTNTPLTSNGDSGSPVYLDMYGSTYHAGLVFGSVNNDTGCISTNDVLDTVDFLNWGTYTPTMVYNPSPKAPGNYQWPEISSMLAKNMVNSIEQLPDSVKNWLKQTTQS